MNASQLRVVPGVCQACRRAPVECVVSEDDAAQPYLVCHGCAARLYAYSLRPLEWFNLASVHGPNKFLLHDDFYDDGEACQPEEDVVDAARFPAPALAEVAGDLARLVDYAITRYWLMGQAELVEALARHNGAALLAELQKRVALADNVHVESIAYEVCARVIGPPAADWIRARWSSYRREVLHALAGATARCLPFEEGWSRVAASIEDASAAELAVDCHALAAFRSPRALDWIESHLDRVHYDNFGRLAALSRFSWPRAAAWLEQGRPLSLVALQALIACYHHDTAMLREHQPVLEAAPSLAERDAVLDAYAAQDRVPRVRNQIGALKGLWAPTEPSPPPGS